MTCLMMNDFLGLTASAKELKEKKTKDNKKIFFHHTLQQQQDQH